MLHSISTSSYLFVDMQQLDFDAMFHVGSAAIAVSYYPVAADNCLSDDIRRIRRSYEPNRAHVLCCYHQKSNQEEMVGLAGLEPATKGL